MDSIRTRMCCALTTAIAACAHASPALADDAVGAAAALAFWMTWGFVYLTIGAALMAIAVALTFGERRAWASLLRWTADDGRATDARTDPVAEHDGAASRAA